jgi:sugar O-acyltransferase (sialic acid O-acetyltransferase NeuD family)
MNLLGVGGHAKVVIDAARMSGRQVVAVYDDAVSTHSTLFCGYNVEGSIDADLVGEAIIAIGNNAVRHEISMRLSHINWQTIIHPSAIIAEDVEIGEGSVVMAGAIVQTGTKIGRHCIINTGATVDHDCVLGDFVHIAPNCAIAGGVNLGDGSFIGIGSSVVQYKSIGEWSTIGAGSVVIHDIPSMCTAVGAPAVAIKFHNKYE